MAYHDYEKIKEIKILDVVKKLGLQMRGRNALCFMHDDQRPSLTIYKGTNSWYCYTCCKGGGVIDLVESYFNYDRDKACKWLEVEFDIQPRPANWKWKKPAKKVTTDKDSGKIEVDREILDWIIANTNLTTQALHFLDEERKIKKNVYEGLNIRALDKEAEFKERLMVQFGAKRLLDNHILSEGKYGYKLTWNGPCLLIPYYNYEGRIVNIQSRYLGEIKGAVPPRFRFIKDSKTSLYNAQKLQEWPGGEALLVTEGVTDALAAMSAGIKAVAVAGVSAFKDEYADMLCNYALFICPDNDKPGKSLVEDMRAKLKKRMAGIRVITLDDGSKDLGEYYAKHEELRFGK